MYDAIATINTATFVSFTKGDGNVGSGLIVNIELYGVKIWFISKKIK